MKFFTSLLTALSVLSGSSAFAANSTDVYDGSVQDRQDLESAIKASFNGSVKNVSCRHVISVATGGTMGRGIAGICILDKSESQLSCLNVMLGSTGSSVRLHGDLTEESELLRLIDSQCTGS